MPIMQYDCNEGSKASRVVLHCYACMVTCATCATIYVFVGIECDSNFMLVVDIGLDIPIVTTKVNKDL